MKSETAQILSSLAPLPVGPGLHKVGRCGAGDLFCSKVTTADPLARNIGDVDDVNSFDAVEGMTVIGGDCNPPRRDDLSR
jgi:hypothetical protein